MEKANRTPQRRAGMALESRFSKWEPWGAETGSAYPQRGTGRLLRALGALTVFAWEGGDI